MNYQDEDLFAALALAAERRLRKFNPQEVANMAWAFATANHCKEKLFMALSRAAERRQSNVQSLLRKQSSSRGSGPMHLKSNLRASLIALQLPEKNWKVFKELLRYGNALIFY